MPATEQPVRVACARCKRLHRLGSSGYVKFHGMVTVGEQGGIIGPQPIVWCRTDECGAELLEYLEMYIGLEPSH